MFLPRNSVYPTHYDLVHQMSTQVLLNLGSGNGLLADGTKPLPEPMLTYH